MVKLVSILLSFILLSCLKKDDEGFYIFKIKKGNHRSTSRIELKKTNNLSFSFMLTESCKYETKSTENQYDINKLFGMSDGGSHMKNSARLGWRYLNNKFEIFGFIHNNGQFYFEKICDVEPNVEYNCMISFMDKKYKFYVGSSVLEMDRYQNTNKRNYLLYPYFGGDEVAVNKT